MKVLILGASGMLGHRLFLSLSQNHEVWGTIRSNEASIFTHFSNTEDLKLIKNFNILDLDLLDSTLKNLKPNLVINCIGIIKQVAESKDYAQSIQINSLLPHQVANICYKNGTRFIHFSTDCVFDGQSGSYTEKDLSNADDLYGRSKRLGEVSELSNSLTLRTSIIGRELFPKGSLLEWFLSQNKQVSGFSNAIFSGFPTQTISQILADYIIPNSNLSGLYHLSADPINKFELLKRFKVLFSKEIDIKEQTDFKIDRSLNSSLLKSKVGNFPTKWDFIEKDLLIDSDIYKNIKVN